MITYPARAKINLSLHITGQRDDGYHQLDSIVTFTEFGDSISVAKADRMSLTLKGPYSRSLQTEHDNLVMCAAAALADSANMAAKITLVKNLPISSGIGGGSADAAAALWALNDLWELGKGAETLCDIGLTLGADLPMCVKGVPAQISGIGEGIRPIQLPDFHIVLVNPNVSVSTPEVFRTLGKKKNTQLPPLPVNSDREVWIRYLNNTRNDLQAPAEQIAPEITMCLDALKRTKGCAFARMSGSGATCFGLYDNSGSAQEAARAIAQSNPSWWVQLTKTLSSTLGQ